MFWTGLKWNKQAVHLSAWNCQFSRKHSFYFLENDWFYPLFYGKEMFEVEDLNTRIILYSQEPNQCVQYLREKQSSVKLLQAN